MTRKPFVLVPPSEAKSVGGSRVTRAGEFDAMLARQRVQVVESIAQLVTTCSMPAIEKVLQARGPLLERALVSLDQLVAGHPALVPAWRRYVGVVWSHLDAGALTSAQRRRLLIPSGLYGVTSAVDLIADYRLKMDVTLTPLGRLANFWRADVTSSLIEHTTGSVVVNLLPREHAACVDWTRLSEATRVVDVSFVRADGRSAVGHAAKAVKGVLARALVERGVGIFEAFEWQGWHVLREYDHIRIVAPTVEGT